MNSAQVFELAPSGRADNIFTICGCGLVFIFLVGIVWYARRLALQLRQDSEQREGRKVLGSLFQLVQVIFFAVLAGLGSGGGGASGSVVTGYTSRVKQTRAHMLGVCILGIIVFSVLLLQWTVFEPPLQLAVSPQQVTFQYRLSWRNWSVPVGKISRVDLIRYRDRHNRNRLYYNLVVYYDSTHIRIKGTPDTEDRYIEQMKAAYDAIESARSREAQ